MGSCAHAPVANRGYAGVMVTGTRRKLVAMAALLSAGLALGGCGSEELPSSAEAGPKFQQLSTDLADALTAAFPDTSWHPVPNQVTRLTEHDDGTCVLSIGTLRYNGYLPDAAGSWGQVMDTINPVLTDAGFNKMTSEKDIPGGWSAVESSDSSRGEVRLAAKSYTDLNVKAEVSDPDCTLQIR